MLTLIGLRKQWRLVAVLLASPAVSVLAAVGLVWANGNVLSGIPLGVHTLVPLALLVPLPVLAVAAAAGLLLALALLATGRSGDRAGRVCAAEVMVLLPGAQAVLFAAQILVVDQLHGVPDAGLVLLLAAALQTVFIALTAAGAIALRIHLPAAPTVSTSWLRLPAATFNAAPVPIFASRDAYRIGSRRGPPILLLSD
jgi:hypothetical protein